MFQSQLKSTLQKVLETGQTAELTESELELLRDAAGLAETSEEEDQSRPTWSWIRENLLRFQAMFPSAFDLTFEGDEELAALLSDAAERHLTNQSAVELLGVPLRRSSFVGSLKKHVQSRDEDNRCWAIRMAGLANVQELKPLILSEIQTGERERDFSWTDEVLPSALMALTMLEAPEMANLAEQYKSHSQPEVRAAVYMYYTQHPDAITDEALADLLKAEQDEDALGIAIGLLGRAARGGADMTSVVSSVAEKISVGDAPAWLQLGRVVAESEDGALLETALNLDYEDARTAVILECMRGHTEWAVEALTSRLKKEDSDTVSGLLVAAIGCLHGKDDGWLQQWKGSDDWEVRQGAVWAAFFCDDSSEQLRTFLEDGDEDVRANAQYAVSLKQGERKETLDVLAGTLQQSSFYETGALLAALCTQVSNNTLSPSLFNRAFMSGLVSQEEATEFYSDHLLALLQCVKHVQAESDEDTGPRVLHVAASVGGEEPRKALEDVLITSDESELSVPAYLELLHLGGPNTSLGMASGELLHCGEEGSLTKDRGNFIPVLCKAFTGDDQQMKAAVQSFVTFGAQAEVPLRMFLLKDDEMAELAMDQLRIMDNPEDWTLRDLRDLLYGSPSSDNPDVETLMRYAVYPAPAIRKCVVQAIGSHTDVTKVWDLLLNMSSDEDEEVVMAALQKLVELAPEEEFVKNMILAQTWSRDWEVRQQTVDLIKDTRDRWFVPRLVEMFRSDDDNDVMKSCWKALASISAANPDLGLIVLDASDPHEVVKTYELRVDIDPIFDEDEEKAKALELLLQALYERADSASAAEHRGRKLLLQPVAGQVQTNGTQQTLSLKEWEAIAVYLSVLYVDAESGGIVAQVGDEPSGEILNAVLQDSPKAVITARWS